MHPYTMYFFKDGSNYFRKYRKLTLFSIDIIIVMGFGFGGISRFQR
jgi:hypothetical protein